MRVHRLNCGTMRPPRTPGGLLCHVLLLETDNGLVLAMLGSGNSDDGEGDGVGDALDHVGAGSAGTAYGVLLFANGAGGVIGGILLEATGRIKPSVRAAVVAP